MVKTEENLEKFGMIGEIGEKLPKFIEKERNSPEPENKTPMRRKLETDQTVKIYLEFLSQKTTPRQ